VVGCEGAGRRGLEVMVVVGLVVGGRVSRRLRTLSLYALSDLLYA
jgi:hypothetical protein